MARQMPKCYVCGKQHETRQPVSILLTTCERDLIKKAAYEQNGNYNISPFLRGVVIWYLDPAEAEAFQAFHKTIAKKSEDTDKEQG